MDFRSFMTSIGTSFFIFLMLMAAFTWLHRNPSNAVIYYPSRISRGLPLLEGRTRLRNHLAWIEEAVVASEDDVIAASGLDAVTYLVFLNSVLMILVFSGVVLLPVLLPVAATDKNPETDTNNEGSFSNLDKLAMGHVQRSSPRLWAFLLGVYWVSFITYFILWKSYKHVSDLRAAAKSSPGAKPEEFAVLARDIPPAAEGQSMKDHVDTYFKALHPDTFYRSMIVTDNTMANQIWDEIESYRKKLARAEFVYEESKTAGNPEGVRPIYRTGFLGLVGEKVDTINHCNEKIEELIPKLQAEQKTTLREKQQAAALIFFNSKPAATSASQTIHAQKIDTWTVMEAPEPQQIIWTNLSKKYYERQTRSLVVYGIVFVTICFYMVPIAFVSGLTTLPKLRKYLPFLKPIIDHPKIRTILQAFLPQLALIIFMTMLPILLMFLSKQEGFPSESHAVRASSGKYFYFIIFNVFLGVTIGGTLIQSLQSVIEHPRDAIRLLGESLPKSATFFITYVSLKFFVGYGLEISRIIPLIIFLLNKKFLCKTEAEVKEAWAPGDFCYDIKVPNDMLIATIVLCYSVIAPIILPFGVVYFGLGWLITRNQALKVYIPTYESNGRMWPHMHARIMAGLIIYQFTMLGYIGILRQFRYAPLLIPVLISSFVFAFVCKKHFYLAFAQTPLEIASQGTGREIPNMDAMYTAYIPPCLNIEKFDDDVFEDAHSYSMRSMSF